MATKICTATGFCMKCAGTLDDAFKAINSKEGGKFLCCWGNCIKIDDISTIQTVTEEKAPEDDDDDGRPVSRGLQVEVEGPRDSGGES